jgi:flagellar biosynthesis component FlhA
MFSEWSAALTGKSLDQSGTLVISLQLFTVVVVGVRLLFELRSSRGATALASAAVACCIAAFLMQHAEVGASLQSNREFVAGNLWLWTAALSLMCLVTYARFVILHASGAIYVPEKSVSRKKKKRSAKGKAKSKAKPKKSSKTSAEADDDDESEEESSWSTEKEEDEAEEESDEEEESKSKSGYSAPLSGKMKSSGRSASSDEDEDEESDESSTSGLSRAERKRLKREQRQGRRAA